MCLSVAVALRLQGVSLAHWILPGRSEDRGISLEADFLLIGEAGAASTSLFFVCSQAARVGFLLVSCVEWALDPAVPC